MKIDYNLLKKVCLSPIDEFKALGDVAETKDGIYVYKENPKTKILAVAHLDSVLDLNHFHVIKDKKETYVINAQLDDRLGVYILLDLLPQMGIEYDLLLTEGEEIGRSTGAHFSPTKAYNWMFSFDRRLDDVVMYQYENQELTDDLKQVGFKIGNGSFSDIDFMNHLGIRGFNVGTGYNQEHHALCHAYISMVTSQIYKFCEFYDMFQDKQYLYTAQPEYVYSVSKWMDDTCYICENVSPKGQEINDVWICDDCIGDALECPSCGDIVDGSEIIDDACEFCRTH